MSEFERLRGVNLGGWLVLERWITPELFEGMSAHDETEFCQEFGDKKVKRLDEHRKTYITADDFKWIAAQGLNAVRIPVPHWTFGNSPPYVGCIEFLDFAMETAHQNKLQVIIDVHTAPGSQNGYDHSGITGQIEWHKDASNIERTLEVIEKLAERYENYPSMAGIELLNEPSPKIPHNLLLDFYKRGYERVRKHCNQRVAVVVSDAYRPHDWRDAFDMKVTNILLDVHLYQAFSWQDKRKPIHKILRTATHDWRELITELQQHVPVIVGEWSLGLDKKVFRGMDAFERDKALQAYAAAQLRTFSETKGHFFWTYKTSNMAGWSYRDILARGWLAKTG